MTEKSREQKLRRAAQRQGMIAMKGRGKNERWMIVDANTNFICAGGTPTPFCLSLEEAENYIYSE